MQMKTSDSNRRDYKGAALIEYVLLVALIALAGVVAIKKVGDGANAKAEFIQSRMETASGEVHCNPGDPGFPDC